MSAWSRRTASAAWTSRSNRRRFRRRPRSRSTDLSARSGRMYGIPLGNLLAGRSSTSGKLFTHSDAIGQTDVTLDELGGLILLCCQTGVIATQWDDLPIQPEFFAPTLPQEPKTSADNGARPTEEKTAETPEPLDPAVPAQSLPSSDASKTQFDELSTEFSSNSELYPQNSNPESTVSTESTSTDTVNTVPADRITQSSANTLHPASAESVKTAESYPSANPEPPQPIPDSAAQPLHMTSADFPAAAAVPPSRAALYLQLQDQFPEFHPFPDDDLTDCLRLSLDGSSTAPRRRSFGGCEPLRPPWLLVLSPSAPRPEPRPAGTLVFRRPRRLHAE